MPAVGAPPAGVPETRQPLAVLRRIIQRREPPADELAIGSTAMSTPAIGSSTVDEPALASPEAD